MTYAGRFNLLLSFKNFLGGKFYILNSHAVLFNKFFGLARLTFWIVSIFSLQHVSLPLLCFLRSYHISPKVGRVNLTRRRYFANRQIPWGSGRAAQASRRTRGRGHRVFGGLQ